MEINRRENTFDNFFDDFAKGLFVEILQKRLEVVSKRQLSNKLGCSRRALNRYLSRERNVPISIMKRFIIAYSIDEELLFQRMKDDEDTYCSKYQPETIDGKIVWYGKNNDIINSLFVLRRMLKLSFFEMSYKTELNPDRLYEYECGKKMIQPMDVDKILETLNISLIHLFPQLYSFDGGKTYLPLNVFHFKTGDNEYWEDYYTDENNVFMVESFQRWPINYYDSHGKVISNLMPNELSVDAYFQVPDIFLCKGNDEYFDGPAFDLMNLPPNYYRYQTLYIEDYQKMKKNTFEKEDVGVAKEIEIKDNYKIEIVFSAKTIVLDISPYINSNSQWYQELKNDEYLHKGKLIKVEELKESSTYFRGKMDISLNRLDEIDAQIIYWPNGQYIRIDELPMDMDPYSKHFNLSSVASLDMLGNWMVWS